MELDYKNMLVDRLFELQQFQKFTDVVLVINKMKYYCHRNVLAAASDVFASMFGVEMREKSDGVVELSELDINEVSFSSFIRYVYTGKIEITIRNVDDILLISNFLLMNRLKTQCFNFLDKLLSPSNCLNILVLTDKFGNKQLYFKAKKIICENFLLISSEKTFLQLDFCYVKSILSSDELEVPSEDNILVCCIDWLNHNFSERIQYISDLIFSCVRIRYVSSSNMKLLKRLQEKNSKHISVVPVVTENFQSLVRPRACLDTYPVVVATGGYDGNKCLMTSFIFCPNKKKWGHIAPMKLSRHDHGMVILKNLLVVIGGFNTVFGPLDSVEGFNPIRNTWFDMPSMCLKRKSHGACIYQNKIYVSGGLDGNYNVLKSAEYFNNETQCWEFASGMIKSRYAHGLVANDKYLFAIGGWKTNTCEFYDGSSWSKIAAMKYHRAGASCLIYGGKIFVYGGYSEECCLSSLEIFDIENQFWIEGASSNVNRWRAGSTIIDNNIFIVGGRNSSWQYLNSVETYSLSDDAWEEREPLPFGAMGLKCCVINIPRSQLKIK